jgi:NodT family efflux transporter outer membrane factor (OMF) lipoprotein
MIRRRSGIVLAFLLTGCAVGPDFETPKPPAVEGYTADPLPAKTAASDRAVGEAQSWVRDLDIPGQWWTLFRSPGLNALIDRALQANPDLAAAQAALRNARQNLEVEQAALFPTIQGSYSPSRQKNATGTLAPTLTSNQPIYTLHTTQLTLSYTLDVFGGERRQIESLEAQAEQQRFLTEAAYLTLTSNLVAAAIREASLRAQIEADQRLVTIERDLTNLTRKQRDLGQLADADVFGQESLLAASEATLLPLQNQLAVQRDLVTALIGGFPGEPPAETFTLDGLGLPTDLPVSLPSKLVTQRPDVRAAEANLHAATAQVGVAIANLLPNFAISASTGSSATDIARLFTSGQGFWTLVGTGSQTLFDGGALLAKRRGADALMDQAAAQYESTVIAAFQNVADTLHTIQSDGEVLKAEVASERAAERSLDLVRRELPLGAVSQAGVLTAEVAYQQAVAARVQAEAARLADTASLFQALGGGWWNRKDVEMDYPDRASGATTPG